MAKIASHKELTVWKNAMDAAMRIFEVTRSFPVEEKYSMVDQIRRSSRSVAANLAEAWRRRRYEAAFPANLNDAEAEASEVQTGIERAFRCGSINQETAPELDETYEPIIGPIVTMIRQPGTWTVDRRSGGER
ncbi:four helix bundle protein [Roseiflexus castenholzii]|uniref:four helix bundle protein n=1 Tax=Roseiflexus castenholzii TaxID=120962 RepID=UPI003C799B48